MTQDAKLMEILQQHIFLNNGFFDEKKHRKEAHNAILAWARDRVPAERKGKHLDHQEDDGYFYNCGKVVPEEERGSFGDWVLERLL